MPLDQPAERFGALLSEWNMQGRLGGCRNIHSIRGEVNPSIWISEISDVRMQGYSLSQEDGRGQVSAREKVLEPIDHKDRKDLSGSLIIFSEEHTFPLSSLYRQFFLQQ